RLSRAGTTRACEARGPPSFSLDARTGDVAPVVLDEDRPLRAPGRDQVAYLAACAAALLRHASAGERSGSQIRPNDAWAFGHLHDADLHARLAGAASEDV